MGRYDDLAARIVEGVGGRENICSLIYCPTKLRFKLNDEEKADTKGLKTMQGIITVIKNGGQYQIVIGNHAPDVYQAVVQAAGIPERTEEGCDEKKGILTKTVDTISGIFAPTLGVLSAAGIVKGLNVLFLFLGWYEKTSAVYRILQTVGDGFFYFLPVIIGLAAARKFGVNQFIGMAIGAGLVYPGVQTVVTDGARGVIPVILAVWLASYVERFLKKIIPDMIKLFFVPFVTLLIIVPATLLAAEPFVIWMTNLVKNTANMLYDISPILAGLFVGGLWPVFVIFGIRWEFAPTVLNSLPAAEYDNMITAVNFAALFAQVGAILAVMIKTKDKKLRAVSIPAFLSGIFGVAEPGVFGVTLPKKIPFLLGCIGAAAGGAMIGGFGLSLAALSCGVAFLLTFLMVLLLYKEARKKDKIADIPVHFQLAQRSEGYGNEIGSPLNGKIVPLAEVKDEVFSSAALGEGIAIEPYEGVVYAPADGEVTTFFPSGHAIGITTMDGVDILIHIGMDTVELNGKFFTPLVRQGEDIRKGQKILLFDMEGIKKEGYPLTTPVIITNMDKFKGMDSTPEKEVTAGDALLWVG